MESEEEEQMTRHHIRHASRFERAMSNLTSEVPPEPVEQEEIQNKQVTRSDLENEYETMIINTFINLSLYAGYEKIKFFNNNSIKDFEDFIYEYAKL